MYKSFRDIILKNIIENSELLKCFYIDIFLKKECCKRVIKYEIRFIRYLIFSRKIHKSKSWKYNKIEKIKVLIKLELLYIYIFFLKKNNTQIMYKSKELQNAIKSKELKFSVSDLIEIFLFTLQFNLKT